MEARLIPFPSGKRRHDADRDATGIFPDRLPDTGPGRGLAEVALELRRLEDRRPRMSRGAEAVRQRVCLETALRMLCDDEGSVRLAGTREHPVLEASYEGPAAGELAAHAVLRADRAVRLAGGGKYVVAGGVATGRVLEDHRGVRVVVGSPRGVVQALIDRAAPGQILLGGPGWRHAQVDLLESRGTERTADASIFVLRGVR